MREYLRALSFGVSLFIIAANGIGAIAHAQAYPGAALGIFNAFMSGAFFVWTVCHYSTKNKGVGTPTPQPERDTP